MSPGALATTFGRGSSRSGHGSVGRLPMEHEGLQCGFLVEDLAAKTKSPSGTSFPLCCCAHIGDALVASAYLFVGALHAGVLHSLLRCRSRNSCHQLVGRPISGPTALKWTIGTRISRSVRMRVFCCETSKPRQPRQSSSYQWLLVPSCFAACGRFGQAGRTPR